MPDPDVPPPAVTPRPDIPREPGEKTDPGRPVSVSEMRRSNLVTRLLFGLLGAVLTSGAGFGGVLAATSLVRSEARAQAREEVREQMKVVDRVDAGLDGLKARVATLEQQVPQLRGEVYDGRIENGETRKDVRSLQDVILSNRPSPRLSRPLPPPPAPPPPVLDGGPR